MAFITGQKTTASDSADHILDLRNGMDYLNPGNDAIALLKRIGLNGFTAKSTKHEWIETALATRSETITLADGVATTLTVADARIYQVDELIRCENEVMLITAIASATTLTVTRGYGGTTGAAHSAKLAYSLGAADPEGDDAPAGIADVGARLYNYSQIFTRGVELSNDEIMQLSTEGNPMNKQVERRYIEVNRQLAKALFYGVRFEDLGGSKPRRGAGGLKQFVTTNVTNVAGALTISAIDTQILNVVQAGGDPKLLVMSPYQKQKLDALDAGKIYTGKRELSTGGNPMVSTWQSGILGHTVDVLVDHTVNNDELWILDTDWLKIGPYENNGKPGAFHVEDATPPGADYERKVIRGKYTFEFGQQKAQAYLYGLS